MDVTRLGGLITKSISLAPRSGNAPPRVAELPGGMLNAVGLANPGVASVARRDVPRLLQLAPPAQVILSVVGFRIDEYAEVIDALEGPDVAAIELNLSCPNSEAGGIEFGADAVTVAAVVSSARATTDIPLVAKLSPASPQLGVLAAAACAAGAAGVSVVNTIPGTAFDPTGAPRLGLGRGGVSGPGLLPVGLQAVATVVEHTEGKPVIGVGGIRSAADVRQYLRAGASLVAIGTAALADPRLPERVVRDLQGGTDG
jgi:dihydroorotate dehydrogenase (NAD+) catalytic subunit